MLRPSGTHDQISTTVRQSRACRFAPTPDERTGRLPTAAAGLASAVTLGSESRGAYNHTPPSQIRDFPIHRLPRLSGPRWRHSTLPLHGISNILYFYFVIGPACDIITFVSLFVFDQNEHSRILKKLLYMYSTE
jgi:hypothetical protein